MQPAQAAQTPPSAAGVDRDLVMFRSGISRGVPESVWFMLHLASGQDLQAALQTIGVNPADR